MKRALVVFVFAVLFAVPSFAFEADCATELEQLGTLYQLRSLMARSSTTSYDVSRFVDRRIDELREPLRGGGHRWVRWVRPAGDGPVARREHVVLAVHDGGGRDRVEANAGRVYAATVAVPRKRSLLHGNNPVWVGDVEVTYEVDGETATKRETIRQWMNPGTSRTIDLGVIADRAHATLEAATAPRHVRQALVETHLRQAVSEDDPANPSYGTIRMLQRIRDSADAETIDAEIAAAERELNPAGGQTIPLLTILAELRRAEALINSEEEDDQEEGAALLKETLRRLR